jgi:Zn-dependent hydrolases, including glyoxylases
MVSRSNRLFAHIALGALVTAVFGWTEGEVLAQADSPVTKINAEAAKANISVQHLRGNVSVLMGSGGNITVLTGNDGTLLVDAGIALSEPRLGETINRVRTGPIKYLINTHWHWDHTDGNEQVHKAGAVIVAHENTLKHLSTTIRVDDWNYTFQPIARGGLPTEIVNDERKLGFDGNTVTIKYYSPAHTDGDLNVYLSEADILATGDTFWNGVYPFIDAPAGGSIDGMIRAANANIASAGDNTLIVSGHGPIGNRAQLIEYRDMLVNIREAVAKLKRDGKSLDEAIAAKPTARYDAKWGGGVIDPAFFVRLVYRGV